LYRYAAVEDQGLLNPLAIMGENAERMNASMAPPKTLAFLDTVGGCTG
jgi:hypothetical protein